MSETIDPNKQISLDEALAQYGLEGCGAELIRHNENMTFRVGSRYLLRIHKHKVGFTTEPLYEGLDRPRLYESELSFIKHLKTCGLNVQSPVPNKKESCDAVVRRNPGDSTRLAGRTHD